MKRTLLLTTFMLLSALGLYAQNIRVSGVVIDSSSEPVYGASVLVKGTNTGVLTDAEGKYEISAPSDASLEFSILGMVTKVEPVHGRSIINVVMTEDNTWLETVVVVGYGTQKRGSVTGAVAGLDGDNLVRTKNENPQNMLTGRIPGVRVWQKSAEPGTYNNSLDIRGLGEPLVVIDGVPRSTDDFQRLNANDIENISVLKDASAAIYGVRGGNGVILVTTKKGSEGKASVQYNGSFTFQMPSTMPRLADAIGAMTLYNEMALNKSDGSGAVTFTDEYMEQYRNGTKTAADWNSLVFADVAPQTQHDVSISGGTEKYQYYVSMGYIYQEGFFRSGDLNYSKYNLRSNIDAEIARGLKFNMNISGVLDNRSTPDSDAVTLIRNLWKQGVLFPAYADEEQTMLNYEGLDLMQNTVAMMTRSISGYKDYREKQFQSSASLEYDFGTLTDVLKGLSLKGMASYDFRYDDNEFFRKSYNLYAKDELTGEYVAKEFSDHSDRLTRENYTKSQMLGQVILNYNRTFAEKHDVGATFGYEAQRRKGDNYYLIGDLAFSSPYLTALKDKTQSTYVDLNSDIGSFYDIAYQAIIGRANYAFDNRYLLEAQFRYDGSSKFAPGHQWGFFPSASVGWRISEEPFFKNCSFLSFINQFKIRASYGSLGDDNDLNYEWLSGYIYPATGNDGEKGYYSGYAPAYLIDGEMVYGVDTSTLPNTNITWLTSRTFNVGVDFEAWNGLLGITFDYFERSREGVFGQNTSSLPTVVGADAPVENLNSDRNLGLELQISHRNKVGDFNYGLTGIVTITRRQNLKAYGQGPYGNSYDRWRNDNLTNRYQGVQFGYESAGRYESWEDIWTYDIYKEGDTLPGDYKYLDWNGDGEISSLDEHPYAFDQTPWMNYSLSFNCDWKGLDFSMLLQGSALGSYMYDEPLYSIWGSNGGGALEQFLDRWHPVGDYTDPYDQTLEWTSGHYAFTGHSPEKNSSFNRVSTTYLRLKSIELGYTLPKNPKSQFGLRVFVNAYNLLTLTGVKYVDPEHPDSDYGRMYPLNKTVSLGMNLTF
jgi:TonB-linked SusC/RagA family outer membrane protein